MEVKYQVCCKENGDVIEDCETLDEAITTIAQYEEQDRSEDNYTPDFYEIYDIRMGKTVL